MNPLKSSGRFNLSDPQPPFTRPHGMTYLCIAACLCAACITLSPDVGEQWSQSTYPTLVAVNHTLVSWGITSDGPPASSGSLLPPDELVMLSRIEPDETVTEKSRAEKLAELDDAPKVGTRDSVTIPVSWRRPLGETSYRFDTDQLKH